ncbi:oxidoreductase [Edaphobacter dinghuensis]|uniref:Short-chain dehydrogenase/reductase n=1 Tax=Edaphobacter dinghuensis TaxID=1560005 RepID=A0A917H1A6_9BACT|nr:oxidoreductase [Edaphobacter dinghuensis]GGG63644.1 short-chain dehydrogenase/reductase [Edaphobacter dinghuensis]
MANITTTRTWFITGASTGFGRILAEEVLKGGGKVIATARSRDKVADLEEKYPEKARAFALDVTDPAQILSIVAQTLTTFGPVDVLVNNAGYGLAGGIEEATEEEFMPVFETNVFGLIRVTRAFLPHFRKQRSGNIVNLSSIGGLIGSAGWGYYNASKFAVEGFSEALAVELAPLGVHVTIVEPGPFRTDFLGRSGVEAKERIADYDSTAGKTREYFHNQAGKQKGDPLRAVHAIIQSVESPQPPLHLVLGALALQRMRGKLDQWKAELNTWESTTVGADFPEGE